MLLRDLLSAKGVIHLVLFTALPCVTLLTLFKAAKTRKRGRKQHSQLCPMQIVPLHQFCYYSGPAIIQNIAVTLVINCVYHRSLITFSWGVRNH